MKSGYTLIELLVVIVMVIVFAMMVTLVVLGVKGCQHVQEKGLKNVATQVWEGKGNTATNTP